MLKAVIFDFDGTIADTFPAVVKVITSIMDEEGFDMPEGIKEVSEMKCKSQMELMSLLPFSKVKIPHYIKKIREGMFEEDVLVFKGMTEVLEELNEEYRMGIITSNSGDMVRKVLGDRIDIFEEVVSGVSLFGKAGKIKKMLRKLGVEPEEAVFVGDDERDIEACNADGVPIISVTWGYQDRSVIETAAPDYIADSPEEIIKIIKAIA